MTLWTSHFTIYIVINIPPTPYFLAGKCLLRLKIEEGYIEYGNIENCNIEFEVK
jgi:hypothetical protein